MTPIVFIQPWVAIGGSFQAELVDFDVVDIDGAWEHNGGVISSGAMCRDNILLIMGSL